MHSPRIYWICSHQTLRYEEVPLLIEAGAEVIPSLGDPKWFGYDSNYDNENDILYPQWQRSCTLPIDIIENIRRIQPWERRGVVTTEEAKLINHYVDVIFIHNHLDILVNISKWFNGYIVFRALGCGETNTYTKEIEKLNVDINRIVENDKFVWSPIYRNLEDSSITKRKYYLNGFVSEERLGFKWKGKRSKPYISTSITSLQTNVSYKEYLDELSNKNSDLYFVVLEKNPQKVVENHGDKFFAYIDVKQFYSKLTESRLYIEDNSNSKFDFTPIETISMGVPVLFLKESGLAQEAIAYGASDELLKNIGMCSNIQEMKELVLKIINDFQELERISREQANIWGEIFSRDTALEKTKDFFKEIQPYIIERKKTECNKPIYFNIVNNNKRKSIQYDLPTEPGQKIIFSSEDIGSFTGKLVYNNQRKFISQRVEEGMDPPGMLLASYIGKMYPGEYLFSIELNSFRNFNSYIGSFSVAVWNPQYDILNLQEITKLNKGSNTINLVVKISPENSNLTKEIRVVWNGAPTCEISNIVVEKLT